MRSAKTGDATAKPILNPGTANVFVSERKTITKSLHAATSAILSRGSESSMNASSTNKKTSAELHFSANKRTCFRSRSFPVGLFGLHRKTALQLSISVFKISIIIDIFNTRAQEPALEFIL